MSLSIFRSRELAFWLAAVLALGGLMLFAATRNGEPVPGGVSTLPVGAPAAEHSQAVTQVRNLQALMPSGVGAGVQPASLIPFADAVAEQAQQGASIRSGEGADGQDPMLRTFQRVSADAGRLRASAGDPVAATALRTQVGLGVSQLHLLSMGQPAPDLPAAGVDPLGGLGGPAPQASPPIQPQPDPARPATTRRPSAPTVGTPTMPAPVPPVLPETAR